MFLVKSGSIWLQLSLCKIPTSLPQEFMSFRQRCQDGSIPSLLELGDCAKEEEKKQKLNSRHNVLQQSANRCWSQKKANLLSEHKNMYR